MGTKYAGVTVTGYNASPPADDGTQVDSNKLEWQKHLDKIGAPLKTAVEAIDTAVAEHLDQTPVAKSGAYTTVASDHLKTIECTGTFTLTLLAVATAGAGYTVTIKNVSTGTITIDGSGSETIDGSASVAITENESTTVQVDAASGAYLITSTHDLTTPAISVSDLTIDDTVIESGTAQATTSGTEIDFTGIPSWAKKITLMFEGVSTDGTSGMILQLGDSGGFETTGYLGSASLLASSTVSTSSRTTGLPITEAFSAATILHGSMVITNLDSNMWTSTFTGGKSNSNATYLGGGSKSLSATLDSIRITMVNGTDVFDAGSVNIMYE